MFDIDNYVEEKVAQFVEGFFEDTRDQLKEKCVRCFRESVKNYHGFSDNLINSRGLLPIPHNCMPPVSLLFRMRSPHNAQDGKDEAMQEDCRFFYSWEYGVSDRYFFLLQKLTKIQTPSDLAACYKLFRSRPIKYSKIQNALGLTILKNAIVEVYSIIYTYVRALHDHKKQFHAELAEEVFEQFKQSNSVEMKAIQYILCEKKINGEQEVDQDSWDILRRIPSLFDVFFPSTASDKVLDKGIKLILLKLIKKELSSQDRCMSERDTQLKAAIKVLESTESDQAFDEDIKLILMELIEKELSSQDSCVLERYKKIQEAITAAKHTESTEKDPFFRDLINIISLKPRDKYFTDLCKDISCGSGQYQQRVSVAQKLLEHLYHVDSETYESIVSKLKKKNIDELKISFLEAKEDGQQTLEETNVSCSPTITSA